MSPIHSRFYADWREQRGRVPGLREDPDLPSERLMQAIWFHQRIRRDNLVALDGRALQVLHPGFWNREAGPDFREAVIKFEGEAPRSGDIEIDLFHAGWHGHGHDANPNYRNVILHVVWEDAGPTGLPTLVLRPLLDAPPGELAQWLGSDAAKKFPLELLGHCSAPLRDLSPGRRQELLRQASLVRLHAKAAHFQARARQCGWEQALWEGLFRALGYKQNVWPMQRLGELRARLVADRASPLALQARLLGAGGLLPEELTRTQAATDSYLRRLWDAWWRERESFGENTLPRTLWKFNNLRPANHPQRRLALAAHWLVRNDLPGRLEQWCLRPLVPAALLPSLLEVMQGDEDEFWSWHWTLRSRRLAKPQPLLGATRVTDLAVNVVLPWLWVRAAEGRNDAVRQEMENRYLAWPAAQDNALLRLARQRLLGGASTRALPKAAEQQGLLQVVKDFCEHSNALCSECLFPELVRQWPE